MRSMLRKIPLLRMLYRKYLRAYLEAEGYFALLVLRFRKRRLADPSSKLVVSLTTYNARLSKLGIVLDSILCQDIDRDYAVSVHLSSEDLQDGVLPLELTHYKNFGVQFFIHSENFRSYKKLVYEYDPESEEKIIVTADDDVIYPKYWLRKLWSTHLQHPRCVVAYRAHFLTFDSEGNFIPYTDMMRVRGNPGDRLTPRHDLMPTGVSGVLYPPRSLHPACLDSALYLAYAPTADDIWFKASALLNNTLCVQVERSNRHFAFIPQSQETALHEQNIQGSRNDVQLRETFNLFPDALQHLKISSQQHLGASGRIQGKDSCDLN